MSARVVEVFRRLTGVLFGCPVLPAILTFSYKGKYMLCISVNAL